jgi:hypothetical protein
VQFAVPNVITLRDSARSFDYADQRARFFALWPATIGFISMHSLYNPVADKGWIVSLPSVKGSMGLEQREGHGSSRAIKSASHQGFSNCGSQVYLGTAAPGVLSSEARQL